jgi:hypothetical protein
MIRVIESFAARQTGGGILTVTRTVTANPAYVDGYPVADASVTTLTTTPTQVSPVDGRGLKILADQGITSESRMLLTATPLFSRSDTTEPDFLTGVDLDNDGAQWRVINVMNYTCPDAEVFYKAIVARDSTQ